MDAFFASVEQLDNSQLIGKPTVVTSHINSPTIIAASYEAKRLGYQVGMRYVANNGVYRCAARPERYLNVSTRIMQALIELCPEIEIFSVDEAFMDFTSYQKIYKDIDQLVVSIQSTLIDTIDLPFSIGIGTNRTIAKLASSENKPKGVCIIQPGHEEKFVYNKPIQSLCGIGKNITQFLNKQGVFLCQDMKKIPISFLSDKYGQNGRHIWRMAHGIDERPIIRSKDNRAYPKQMSNSKVVPPQDQKQLEKIRLYLHFICWRITQRMRAKQLFTKEFTVIVYGYHQAYKISYIHPYPTHSYTTLKMVYTALLKKIKWPNQIRKVIVNTGYIFQTQQKDLFDEEVDTSEHTVDQINSRFGANTIQTAAHLESNLKIYVIPFKGENI
ncbi:hypothetical protein MMH89_03410 [Candidatus Comchoanobacter bicostacola]|uniref:UmuC domain-containing protein n=1 Tax=Candidatus Comchoanobacter bicostacola TaxID=2919598 RepID=A0ABY5DHV4_9GAMM|nr:hypothetical protein [Candidatus Comchoanobacter bicostacola]UTC24271.1 hypothetical protein MMH89_03410 [Candidatus Comchoanobacter bicostacola]